MAMTIKEYPLSDTFKIIVFISSHGKTFRVSGSHVVYDNKFIAAEFSNARYPLNNKHVLGKIGDMKEAKFIDLFKRARVDNPYKNYLKESEDFTTAKDSLISYLELQGWEGNMEKTWVICLKKSKTLRGKKIPMEFELETEGYQRLEDRKVEVLDVYMSYLNEKSKSCKFSVKIPDRLYDLAITNPDEEKRPQKNYFESESLSSLHQQMNNLVNDCFNIIELERAAEKAEKLIIVNFNARERSTRDDYNHGYTGQLLTSSFQFFIAYRIPITFSQTRSLFTFKQMYSGMDTGGKGKKGIVDYEKQGNRRFITSTATNVILKWTQEKEDFLTKLECQFRKLNNDLNRFLSDMDEDKLKLLMETGIKLLDSGEDA